MPTPAFLPSRALPLSDPVLGARPFFCPPTSLFPPPLTALAPPLWCWRCYFLYARASPAPERGGASSTSVALLPAAPPLCCYIVSGSTMSPCCAHTSWCHLGTQYPLFSPRQLDTHSAITLPAPFPAYVALISRAIPLYHVCRCLVMWSGTPPDHFEPSSCTTA